MLIIFVQKWGNKLDKYHVKNDNSTISQIATSSSLQKCLIIVRHGQAPSSCEISSDGRFIVHAVVELGDDALQQSFTVTALSVSRHELVDDAGLLLTVAEGDAPVAAVFG
jgi:hypothetical protein